MNNIGVNIFLKNISRKLKWALYWLLKSEIGSLVAIERLEEHIRALFKNGERFALCTQILKTQMKFKS